MSDHFVTLVIKNSTPQTLDSDSEKIVQLLVLNKLVDPNSASDDLSYKPGLNFQSIMAFPDHHLLALTSNEVKILKGRQIFSEMEGAEYQLTCRQCKSLFDGFESPVVDVIDSFHQSVNEIFRCPNCGFEENLRTANTKGFAAGFLGVEFNNWGPIKDEFVLLLQSELNSAITVIEGHI